MMNVENAKIKPVKFERLPKSHLLIRRLALVVSQHQGFQHEVTLVEEGAADLASTVPDHPSLLHRPRHPSSSFSAFYPPSHPVFLLLLLLLQLLPYHVHRWHILSSPFPPTPPPPPPASSSCRKSSTTTGGIAVVIYSLQTAEQLFPFSPGTLQHSSLLPFLSHRTEPNAYGYCDRAIVITMQTGGAARISSGTSTSTTSTAAAAITAAPTARRRRHQKQFHSDGGNQDSCCCHMQTTRVLCFLPRLRHRQQQRMLRNTQLPTPTQTKPKRQSQCKRSTLAKSSLR